MSRYESKNIDEATTEELRVYGTQFLGIPLEDNLSDAEVLAKVKTANDGATIWIMPAPEIDQTGAPPPPVDVGQSTGGLMGGLGRADPKVRLTLHAEERDGVITSRHKEVGVNGIVWLLKRGESLEVPYRVYLALNDAVRDGITHDSEGEVHHQMVHNTPFNVEHLPSKEEIADYHSRTDDQFVPA